MVSDGNGRPRPTESEVTTDGGRSRLDRIFGSLADPRRRAVLYHLRAEGEADVETLARVVAAWEDGVEPDEVDEERREEVHTDLRHVHLPKLEDYRLLEYDPRSGEASYSHPPEPLDDVIDLAMEMEESP